MEHLRKKQEYGWAGADAVAVENTRLIDGLKEVPEKTRMQSARFSTEQSYTDWQLTLAGEQLTKAAAALERFLEEPLPDSLDGESDTQEGASGAPKQTAAMETPPGCETAMETLPQYAPAMEILAARMQAHRRWQEKYDTLQQTYTEACLLWYEKWQEYEEAFAGYGDL